MTTRALAARVGRVLLMHAVSEKYPTRTAEWILAGWIFAWSYSCALPQRMMVGPVFEPMVRFMPESSWGIVGLMLSMIRILALIGNGHWRPSPGLRLICAVTGCMFWIALFGLYTQAVIAGAADFPMRRCFIVLIIGEFYCCFRCGQDFVAMMMKHRALRAGASGSTGGTGNG